MRLAVAFSVSVGDFADLLVDEAVPECQSQFVQNCLLHFLQILLCSDCALLIGGNEHVGKLCICGSQFCLPFLRISELDLEVVHLESEGFFVVEF